MTSSVPRALRWTSWYHKMTNMWVFKLRDKLRLCWPLSAERFPESFTCEVLVLQFYSWLFYRGSFQYRSSSRLSGTAPNWWQNLLRSQADWCFIIITTTRTPIPIISLGFRDIKGIIYTGAETDYFLVHLLLLYLVPLDVSLALWNTSTQNKWTSQV